MTATEDRVDANTEQFCAVQARLDRADERLARIEARFDHVDERFKGVEARLDRVDERFEGVEARLANIEKDLADFKESTGKRLDAVEDGLRRAEEAIRQNRVVTESLRSDIRVIAEGQTMLLGKLDSLIVSCGGRYASHESTLTSLKVRTSELESRMTRVEKFVRIDG